MRTLLQLLALTAALSLLGCPLEPSPSPPAKAAGSASELAPAKETKALAKPPADAPVHPVVCGCSIKEVGKCGEWAVVDGEHVELSDLGLGAMPFCGKSGLKARIVGEQKDGKLQVTAFELVE